MAPLTTTLLDVTHQETHPLIRLALSIWAAVSVGIRLWMPLMLFIASLNCRWSKPVRRDLGVVLGLAMLSGCGQDVADARLTEYQEQLAAALDQSVPTPRAPDNIGAFPEPDRRLFAIPETREGMLDMFALRGCHIANLVAGRNNQLGRVAPPSQRWLYELALWRRLSGCWNTEVPEQLSADDRERLTRLTRTKTQQLPRVSWNALFDSSEWVGSFSRASSPLPPQELAAVEAQLGALAYLRDATLHQFDRSWTPDSATLEGHLKTLQERPFSAELLRTLMLAERRLVEASRLLESALAERICPADATLVPPPDWLERLETASRRWLTAIDRLFAVHVDPPPAITDYRRRWLSQEAAGAPFPAFQAAREHHTALRTTLDHRCS
ncbi:DUF3080 family protein [Halomonas cerina]|uniref:DUF3080 domain-containing protein n=1 Tax=Halomonas cerina TaxID=447424 RepID=A0A839V8U3_9GAMM|nr:DUF3080 family protein [Halomonas cerina]MBB3189899.1 hypothetical protein [Halomonas cerina]